MSAYLTTPDVIHNKIIEYLTYKSLFNLRLVAKRTKEMVGKYGIINLELYNLNDVKECTEFNNKKIFNKIYINLEASFYKSNPIYKEIITEKLSHTTLIKSLEIEWSDIDCGKAVAELLKTSTSLEYITIQTENLLPEGGVAIGEALKINTSLINLHIENENLGVDGAIAIADALKVNTTLRTLYIIDDNITYEGVMAIAEALKVNTGLTKLYIEDDSIASNEGVVNKELINTLRKIANAKKDFTLIL
jgi:hypothetical protein